MLHNKNSEGNGENAVPLTFGNIKQKSCFFFYEVKASAFVLAQQEHFV